MLTVLRKMVIGSMGGDYLHLRAALLPFLLFLVLFSLFLSFVSVCFSGKESDLAAILDVGKNRG